MTRKKKLFIVTWIGHWNYGTSLQSFALFYKLNQHGFNVQILRDARGKSKIKKFIKFVLQVFHLNMGVRTKHGEPLRTVKLHRFQNKMLKITHYSYKLQACFWANKKHVFITGSDQIWNTHYRYNPFMFLDFAKEAKRIAYASSIGTDDVAEEYKEQVKNHLSKFSHIGVREAAAVKALRKLTGRTDIIQVLDPTFLLTKEDWIKVSNEASYEIVLPERFILCYLIGKNDWYVNDIETVKKKTGINNVLIIPAAENLNFTTDGAIVYKNAGPAEFVDLINKSSFVCTDSFHATAISINLEKPFVEFLRFKDTDVASQNSRIYDVLNHYHLSNRIFSNDGDDWSNTIDYSEITQTLKQDRKESENYLFNSIEN